MTNEQGVLDKKDLMVLMDALLFKNAIAEYEALDIKDENILVTKLKEAELKLVDFEKLFHTEINK